MTNEEAKTNLEKLLLLYDDGMIDFSEIRESVKVAIEALRNSPTQMSGTSDAEFWKKRALEYSKTCCDLLARLSNGTKVDSIQLNENGISFHISTQPEQNSQSQMPGTSDLISRQAAIDGVVKSCFGVASIVIAEAKAIQYIKRLPSVQPEIVRCKECKHHHYDSEGIPYCDRINYGYGWKDDDFCSMAERRTDE